ncbi:hypothetical protein PLICRDRAFT_56102 [Plicaturopsis crispa FD-325 SS-3]|nr:hypothetical protein PLICRDRAFT_56102 [Plicaturopsis crispa FD-325 SS-3]
MRFSWLAVTLHTYTLLFCILIFPCFVVSRLVNTTIDDKFGDPDTGALVAYTPADAWNDGTNCTAWYPDFTQTYQSSWHDGTFNTQSGSNNDVNMTISASVPFTGSAVYVYCIIFHDDQSPDGTTDMVFLLDGEPVGTYQRQPNGTRVYEYNVPVYANASIPSGSHNLSIESGRNSNKSLIMLDYITYSHEDIAHTASRTTVAVIAGTAVPVCAVVIALGISLYIRRNRRRRKKLLHVDGISPVDLSDVFPSPRAQEKRGDGGGGDVVLDIRPLPPPAPPSQASITETSTVIFGPQSSVSTDSRRPRGLSQPPAYHEITRPQVHGDGSELV